MTTYTNILDQYEPKATVSRMVTLACRSYSKATGWIDKPSRAYWTWDCVSNAPEHKFSDDTTADEIVAQLEAEGWDCEVELDGYNRPRIHAIHRETAQALADAKAASDTKFADAEQGYIRYGDVPKGGRSYNYREGHFERGVSCFDAEFAADGSYRLKVTEASRTYKMLAEAEDKPIYRLWGDKVSIGSDGEPVIRVERAERIS